MIGGEEVPSMTSSDGFLDPQRVLTSGDIVMKEVGIPSSVAPVHISRSSLHAAMVGLGGLPICSSSRDEGVLTGFEGEVDLKIRFQGHQLMKGQQSQEAYYMPNAMCLSVRNCCVTLEFEVEVGRIGARSFCSIFPRHRSFCSLYAK